MKNGISFYFVDNGYKPQYFKFSRLCVVSTQTIFVEAKIV